MASKTFLPQLTKFRPFKDAAAMVLDTFEMLSKANKMEANQLVNLRLLLLDFLLHVSVLCCYTITVVG